MGYHYTEWPKLKTPSIPCVAKDVRQMEHLFIAGGNAKLHKHFEN